MLTRFVECLLTKRVVDRPSEPKPVNSRSSLPSGTKKGGNAHSSLLPENTRRISAGHHHSHESTEITRRLCGKGTKKQHEECSVSSAAFQPTTRTKPSMIVKLPISQHSRPQSSNKQAIPQSRPATLKQVDNSKKATSTFKSSNLYLPPHPPALPSSQQTSRFSASGPAPQGTVNALATAVATWLMSLSANAGKVLPVETVRRSLARTSSFLQLCEALEGLGFQCERTELAAIVSGAKYGGTK